MAPKETAGTSKSPTLEHRSKSKRRRVEDVFDLDDPADNLLMATEMMIKKYSKSLEAIEDVKNLALERIDLLEKKSIKLVKAKRKIEGLTLMLHRKYANDQQRMATLREDLTEKMKRNVDIAILESKIEMATEAAEHGFNDLWIWPVVAWREELEFIRGEDPDLSAPSKGKGPASSSKAPKKTPARQSKFVSSSDEESGDDSRGAGGKVPKVEGSTEGGQTPPAV